MDASFSDLESLATEVARRTGSETVDMSSRYAGGLPAGHGLAGRMGSLLEIVGLEPDPSIAMSVVLRMVERVPEAERILWAEKITAERKRSLAVLRVRELRILEAVSGEAGVHGQPASCQIAEWSDWLQLRAAERSTSVSVLERLGESGLTRRVRHLSAERLRALRRAPK